MFFLSFSAAQFAKTSAPALRIFLVSSKAPETKIRLTSFHFSDFVQLSRFVAIRKVSDCLNGRDRALVHG